MPSTPGSSLGDGFDHDQHRGLPAGKHVITHAELVDGHSGSRVFGDACVDALVPSAREDQPRLAGQLGRHRLGEQPAGGRRDDQARLLRSPPWSDLIQRPAPRLGQHHHAWAAAVRSVVDSAMEIAGPPTQVVQAQLDLPPFDRLAEQRKA